MHHYNKYVETKTITRRELIKVTCDKCNIEIPYEGSYSTREFELSFTKGSSWPEGSGDKKGWEVEDLCDNCIEWLNSLLIQNGVKLSDVDLDW